MACTRPARRGGQLRMTMVVCRRVPATRTDGIRSLRRTNTEENLWRQHSRWLGPNWSVSSATRWMRTPPASCRRRRSRPPGLNWRYITLRVLAADLPAAVAGLRVLNFRGINLTIPHKVAILPLSGRSGARCGAHRRGEHRAAGRRPADRREHRRQGVPALGTRGCRRGSRGQAGGLPGCRRRGAGDDGRAGAGGRAPYHGGQPLGSPRRGARPAVERAGRRPAPSSCRGTASTPCRPTPTSWSTPHPSASIPT